MFFVGIDALKHFDDFPNSANLIVLFFVYEFLYAFNYTLPISALLSAIIFFIGLIRTSQFTALLALGYSRRQIFAPVFFISIFITIFYIFLNATPFVYAQERADAIISRQNVSISEDLFVRHNGNYVFFGKINPLSQSAQNIKIFELTKMGSLQKFTKADSAVFAENRWILKNAISTVLPKNTRFVKNFAPDPKTSALKIIHEKNLEILPGFRPKILDTIYQNKPSVSITDAISSLFLLEKDAAAPKIRAILYTFLFVPFFMPLTLFIVADFFPTTPRYTNLALLGFALMIFALVIWGLFFAFSKLSVRGIFSPEFSILLPLFALLIAGIVFFRRLDKGL